jgi:hypothetical protein
MPRLRALPWLVVLDIALILRDRWERLGPADRRRLGEIVRKGRSVSERDKADLRRIVRKLELVDAGRQLAPIVGRRRRRGRR